MNHDHSNHAESVAQNSVVGGSGHLDHMSVGIGEHGSMHSMAFHFGNMETVLFNFWKTSDAVGIVLSCVGIVMICFLMELIRFIRAYRTAQKPSMMRDQVRLEPTVSSFVLFDALLHFVQLAFSYSLMLIFMTFNVWLCLAVLVGEVCSRLFFNILFPSLTDSVSMAGGC